MHEVRLSMDPMNPGQFFACCGLLELWDRMGMYVESRFEVDRRRPRMGQFVARGMGIDVERVLFELRSGQCRKIVAGNENEALAPVVLQMTSFVMELDWWLNAFGDDKSDLKCWAGQQTSYSILSELVRLLPKSGGTEVLDTPAMTTSRFGVDPRSAWQAIDFGFSPNEQKRDAATYPGTEVLGAVGLQGFRPAGRRRRMTYTMWQSDLPISVSRVAAERGWEGLPSSRYSFGVAKRGSYKFFEFAKGEVE